MVQGKPDWIEAYEFLSDYANRLELRLVEDLSDIADWCGKFCGAVLRIAGLLHISKYTTRAIEVSISGENFKEAIAIGDYYLEHAKAAYQLMGADVVAKDCQYILKKLKSNGENELSRRDVMRLCRKFKTVESLSPVLCRLVEYGYLMELPSLSQQGSGRPADVKYILSLYIWDEKSDKDKIL